MASPLNEERNGVLSLKGLNFFTPSQLQRGSLVAATNARVASVVDRNACEGKPTIDAESASIVATRVGLIHPLTEPLPPRLFPLSAVLWMVMISGIKGTLSEWRPVMKRRQVLRGTILGAAGVAVSSFLPGETAGHTHSAKEFSADQDASKELIRSDWKPVFLDEHQNQTLIVLSDLIIPETDTPGAKKALVNRFIDLLLAAETPGTQRSFLNSLAYLDGLSIKQHRSGFVHLPRERQVELLNLIAYPHTLGTWGEKANEFEGFTHFSNLKGWISRAYYSSEIGMRELGWDGSSFHGDLQGCSHSPGEHK